MNFKKLLNDVFEEGTEEYTVLMDTYNFVIKSAPVLSVQSKSVMAESDVLKIKLSTIYYTLSRMIEDLRASYENQYNMLYVKLVKMERPSHHAIETEIKTNYPEYLVALKNITQYEMLKELVTMYIKSLDSLKQSAVEMLRDSRRID